MGVMTDMSLSAQTKVISQVLKCEIFYSIMQIIVARRFRLQINTNDTCKVENFEACVPCSVCFSKTDVLF